MIGFVSVRRMSVDEQGLLCWGVGLSSFVELAAEAVGKGGKRGGMGAAFGRVVFCADCADADSLFEAVDEHGVFPS